MLSLEESKKILNKGERKYTDEEILKIRDFLYELGQLDYENFMMLQREGKLDEYLQKNKSEK